MAASKRDTSNGPGDERRETLAYLGSSEWEKRLEAAREKRKAVLAERAAQDPGEEERRPDPKPEPPRDIPVSEDASPEPRPASRTRRPRTHFVRLALLSAITVAAIFWVMITFEPDPVSDPVSGPVSEPAPSTNSATVQEGSESGDANVSQTPETSESPAPSVTKTQPVQRAPAVAGGPDAATPSAGTDAPPTQSDLAAAFAAMGDDYRLVLIGSKAQVEQFAEDGGTAEDLRISPFEMTRSTVTYFHAADAEGAATLSSRLDAELIDLTGLNPSPPAGTLQVHLAGD